MSRRPRAERSARAALIALTLLTTWISLGAPRALAQSDVIRQPGADTDATSLDNLKFTSGDVIFRIPHAEVEGATLPRDALTGLFDPGAAEPVRERLGRLSANRIAIPLIEAQQIQGGPGRQTTRYSDIVLDHVVNGRATRARIGQTAFTVAGDHPSTGGFRRVEFDDIDLPLILALSERDGAASGQVYGGVRIEALDLADPTGAATHLDTLRGGSVTVRTPPQGFGAVFDALATPHRAGTGGDPGARRGRFEALADLLDSVDVASLEMGGLSIVTPDGGSSRLEAFNLAAGAGGVAPTMRLTGFSAGGRDARFDLADASIEGVRLRPLIDGLRGLGRDVTAARIRTFPASDIRAHIGRISFAMAGLDAGAPSASTPQPVVTIGAVDLSGTVGAGSEAARGQMTVSDIVVPTRRSPGPLQAVADLGYEAIGGTLSLASTYSEDRKEVAVAPLDIRAPGFGSLSFGVVAGHVERDVFDTDRTVAAVAMAGVTIRSLDIELHDDGLMGRILGREARRQNRSDSDLRQEYGLAATVGMPAMLGASDAARTLGAAVARFIARPGRLVIHAESRNPDGIGLAALTRAADPATALDMWSIRAVAD